MLTPAAREMPAEEIDNALEELVKAVNAGVEKHARIGAVIVSTEPWTIENGVLTPTLKTKREEVDQRFGGTAEELARKSAQQALVLIHWQD